MAEAPTLAADLGKHLRQFMVSRDGQQAADDVNEIALAQAAIEFLATRPPVADAGSVDKSAESNADAIAGLLSVISHMGARWAAIQKHKAMIDKGEASAGSARALIDALNDIPDMVALLKSAEFQIESAFEAYEDQIQALLSAPPALGGWKPDREAMARIIDRHAFSNAELAHKWDDMDRPAHLPWFGPGLAHRLIDVQDAYDRVDAILALPPIAAAPKAEDA